MKYLMMIYGSQEKWDALTPEQWSEAIPKFDAFNARYKETGELLGAYGLGDVATSRLVRRENGVAAVTDGPYLETKEHIATLYLLDVESEDRAREIAADLPYADVEPAELWPVLHESA